MTYLFLHLIIHLLFLSPDWLTFYHMIISHINSLVFLFIFCFSLTKGQCSKRQTLLSVSAVHRPFYISIYISTLPTQHTTLTLYSGVYYPYQRICTKFQYFLSVICRDIPHFVDFIQSLGVTDFIRFSFSYFKNLNISGTR